MLVLARKPQQQLVFPQIGATVEVVSVRGNLVRLGVKAPAELRVLRGELADADEAVAVPSFLSGWQQSRALRHAVRNRLNAATIGLSLLRKRQELGQVLDPDGVLDHLERELAGLLRDCEAATSKPGSEAGRNPRSTPRRALLVEDDNNERELLAGFLRLAGLSVDTAGDGLAALDRLRAGDRPDVVLLDMNLPRCDGLTTARAIRRNPDLAGLRIYGVTGHDHHEFASGDGCTAVDRWFSKPLDPQELLRNLDRELPVTT